MNHTLTVALSMSALLLTTACGKKESHSSSTGQQSETLEDAGLYRSVLTAVNHGIGGNESEGAVTLKVTDTNFEVKIGMDKAPGGAQHAQYIYAVDRCPKMENDLNNDGVIDIAEGFADAKHILLPLDGDLNNRNGGSLFPRSNSQGYYTYSRVASLNNMLENLRDPVASESYLTLSEGDKLNLEGKILVVMGVPNNTVIPDSFRGLEGQKSSSSVPIACGEIKRIMNED